MDDEEILGTVCFSLFAFGNSSVLFESICIKFCRVVGIIWFGGLLVQFGGAFGLDALISRFRLSDGVFLA